LGVLINYSTVSDHSATIESNRCILKLGRQSRPGFEAKAKYSSHEQVKII